jgi:hypothetical protein
MRTTIYLRKPTSIRVAMVDPMINGMTISTSVEERKPARLHFGLSRCVGNMVFGNCVREESKRAISD